MDSVFEGIGFITSIAMAMGIIIGVIWVVCTTLDSRDWAENAIGRVRDLEMRLDAVEQTKPEKEKN